MRAVVAVITAALDTASFLVRVVWLFCVLMLAFIAWTLLSALVRAL